MEGQSGTKNAKVPGILGTIPFAPGDRAATGRPAFAAFLE
jgi:hypothetical protein